MLSAILLVAVTAVIATAALPSGLAAKLTLPPPAFAVIEEPSVAASVTSPPAATTPRVLA